MEIKKLKSLLNNEYEMKDIRDLVKLWAWRLSTIMIRRSSSRVNGSTF